MKINRRNDYAFKRIFGHEDTKDILARFLTVVLEVNIEPEEISLIHTELSPEFLQAKESVLDIQVRRSSRHEKLAIEMQLQDEISDKTYALFARSVSDVAIQEPVARSAATWQSCSLPLSLRPYHSQRQWSKIAASERPPSSQKVL